MSKGEIIGLCLTVLLIAGIHFLRVNSKPHPSGENGVSTIRANVAESNPLPRSGLSKQLAESPAAPPVRRTGSVSGTVQFSDSSSPCLGVLVYTISGKMPIVSVQTDERGSYTLAGIPPGVHFSVTAENESSGIFMLDRPQLMLNPGEDRTGLNLTVYSGNNGVISGSVSGVRPSYRPVDRLTSKTTVRDFISITKLPLPGVRVQLGLERVLQETYTDETGRYKFENLRVGDYIVRAERPAGAVMVEAEDPSIHQHVRLEAEPKTDVDLVFRLDGISVTGRVTDAGGRPVESAQMSIERWFKSRTTFEEKQSVTSSTVTDRDGRYRFADLPSLSFVETGSYLLSGKLTEWYTVRVQAQGYIPCSTKVHPFSEQLVGEGFRFFSEYLRFKAKTASPQEIAKWPKEIPNVPLPASKADTITDINFMLDKESIVSGRVFDTRGRPLGGGRQQLAMIPENEEKASAPLAVVHDIQPIQIPLDNEGNFRFEGVRAGRYTFDLTTATGRQKARNEPLAIPPGQEVKDLHLVFEAAEDRGKSP